MGVNPEAANKAVSTFMGVYYLIASLGKPVALCAGVLGAIQYAAGQPHQGIKTVKQAAVGFLLVWTMPGLMKIVEEVGKSLS